MIREVFIEMITFDSIKKDHEVHTFILRAQEHTGAMGFTEHGLRHAGLVAHIAHNILSRLGFPERQAELAAIAGYLHDIGNMISRHNHGETGALLAYQILTRLGMPAEETSLVMGAIGNHEEEYGQSVNALSAAIILADKSDVHRTRVRNTEVVTYDIHDRVNFAAQKSFVRVDPELKTITLELTIDTTISPVMDYFEIFLSRMVMCRRAADFLGCKFKLSMNDVRLL